MLKEKSFILGRISLFIDAGLTALAYWLAFFSWWYLHQLDFDLVLFGYRILPVYRHFTANFQNYSYLLYFIVPLFPLIYESNGLYRSIGFRPRREIAVIIARSILIVLLIIVAIIYITQ